MKKYQQHKMVVAIAVGERGTARELGATTSNNNHRCSNNNITLKKNVTGNYKIKHLMIIQKFRYLHFCFFLM